MAVEKHSPEKSGLQKWGEVARNVFLAAAVMSAVVNPTAVLAWTVAVTKYAMLYIANPANIPTSLMFAGGAEIARRIGKSQNHGHAGAH